MQTEYRAESLVLAQRIAEHAGRRGWTAAQLALAWVWHNRLVHGLIGGPRMLAQWQVHLGAMDLELGAEGEAFVSGLVPAHHAAPPGYTDSVYPVAGRVARTDDAGPAAG